MEVSAYSEKFWSKGKSKGKSKDKGKAKGKGKQAGRLRGFPSSMRPGDCCICGRQGHRAAECPSQCSPDCEAEDEEHLTGYESMWCYTCGGWGHSSRECPTRPRLSSSLYALYPDVFDKEVDGDQGPEMTDHGQGPNMTDRVNVLPEKSRRTGGLTEEAMHQLVDAGIFDDAVIHDEAGTQGIEMIEDSEAAHIPAHLRSP